MYNGAWFSERISTVKLRLANGNYDVTKVHAAAEHFAASEAASSNGRYDSNPYC